MTDGEVQKTVPRGLLVAFEGADGTGKTTQARMAVAALRDAGYDAVYLKEPTDGPHGRRLREIMVAGREAVDPAEELRLFIEDRKEDVAQNIRPALDRGAIVCIDRYYISSMAYQGALGLDPQAIREQNERFAPAPDLVLLFRVPVEEARRRIEGSRHGGANLFEDSAYQRRVAGIFDGLDLPNLVRIDAAQSPEATQEQVRRAIFAALPPGGDCALQAE